MKTRPIEGNIPWQTDAQIVLYATTIVHQRVNPLCTEGLTEGPYHLRSVANYNNTKLVHLSLREIR